MSDRTMTQWDDFNDDAPEDQLNHGLWILYVSAGAFVGLAFLGVQWVFS